MQWLAQRRESNEERKGDTGEIKRRTRNRCDLDILGDIGADEQGRCSRLDRIEHAKISDRIDDGAIAPGNEENKRDDQEDVCSQNVAHERVTQIQAAMSAW